MFDHVMTASTGPRPTRIIRRISAYSVSIARQTKKYIASWKIPMMVNMPRNVQSAFFSAGMNFWYTRP